MPVERILRFIADPATEPFDDLVRAAFAFQLERLEPLRALAERRGVSAQSPTGWRQVPLVPATAFASLELATAPAVEVFRSSGTTSGPRSVHHHPYPELYRAVIDATFPDALFEGPIRPAMLSLVPDREQAPDSSLSFMIDHVLERWGDDTAVTAAGPRGVSAAQVRGFLAARQRDRRPVLVLATSFALVHMLEGLERLGLRFRLPPGSRLFETGGTKGKSREVERKELLTSLAERLDLGAAQVVREYGMTELTSHFYAAEEGVFRPPPWVRFHVLDPATLEELPAGETGLLAIFDLANVGSALHVLTEDLAVTDGDGFRLRGRAAGAQLRGCSLAAEELAGA
ncbi:MAG: hypothetical protein R2991_15035 [Thermoanaerobaculia bacterium]